MRTQRIFAAEKASTPPTALAAVWTSSDFPENKKQTRQGAPLRTSGSTHTQFRTAATASHPVTHFPIHVNHLLRFSSGIILWNYFPDTLHEDREPLCTPQHSVWTFIRMHVICFAWNIALEYEFPETWNRVLLISVPTPTTSSTNMHCIQLKCVTGPWDHTDSKARCATTRNPWSPWGGNMRQTEAFTLPGTAALTEEFLENTSSS